MNQNEPKNTEKIVSQEQCAEMIENYHFILSGMDNNQRCYRFIVKSTVERKDPLTYDELAELCAALCAVCIEVRLEGEREYCWTIFYTTVA